MPYITPNRRRRLKAGEAPYLTTPGDLNYTITTLVDQWIRRQGVCYASLNAAIGVLECAKLELYRRVAASYEDTKLRGNGDVYTCIPLGNGETHEDERVPPEGG